MGAGASTNGKKKNQAKHPARGNRGGGPTHLCGAGGCHRNAVTISSVNNFVYCCTRDNAFRGGGNGERMETDKFMTTGAWNSVDEVTGDAW